ncbi:predicted protein [Histoplasma capsulatum var. duboisii H88]|uniref:Predicted protein n=1 Tax=Ajellomyces capsulatus (strain H88) TaxID=544711 RepID=F0UND5_AJEC8|nr:predicted protein [Histoplasma capsulatum var. duboisii H88]
MTATSGMSKLLGDLPDRRLKTAGSDPYGNLPQPRFVAGVVQLTLEDYHSWISELIVEDGTGPLKFTYRHKRDKNEMERGHDDHYYPFTHIQLFNHIKVKKPDHTFQPFTVIWFIV